MTLCWSQRENFSGRLQQLVINGERILDEAHLKQLHYEGDDDDDDGDDNDEWNRIGLDVRHWETLFRLLTGVTLAEGNL